MRIKKPQSWTWRGSNLAYLLNKYFLTIFRELFDILTPSEFQAIKDRWTVAALLYEGYTYREINAISGVSITTVARVARFLSDGSGGYQIALERL